MTEHPAELPVLYSRFSLTINILHIVVDISQSWSPSWNHSPLPPMSVPHVSNSIPALQIGSSVPFFETLHTCVNIQYLFFFVWLTSLCMTDSGSIHISANGSISFFFYGWVIFHKYSHQLWWEYLHHVNWQVLQIRMLFVPQETVSCKHLSVYRCTWGC